MTDEIKSLDDFEEEYLLLYSEVCPENKYRVKLGKNINTSENSLSDFLGVVVNNDKTIINDPNGLEIKRISTSSSGFKDITLNEEICAFEFVLEYINMYSSHPEVSKLKAPATESNVKYWLEDSNEATLFNEFKDLQSPNSDKKALIRKISIILGYANYLGMKTLVNKCCYLIAFAISNQTPDQISSMFK